MRATCAWGDMKHYRPHILVVIALAVVLMSGWHDVFRNALADLRFSWLQRDASGDIAVIAIDAPSIEKIGFGRGLAGCMPNCSASWRRPVFGDIAFDVDFSSPRIRHPTSTLSWLCMARQAR